MMFTRILISFMAIFTSHSSIGSLLISNKSPFIPFSPARNVSSACAGERIPH